MPQITPDIQAEKPQLKKPRMYKVILLNDDYTPMEFVIDILCLFFAKSKEEAEYLMLSVHHQGKAVCGIYPRDIAESKAARVEQYSRQHDHPLQCTIEPAGED